MQVLQSEKESEMCPHALGSLIEFDPKTRSSQNVSEHDLLNFIRELVDIRSALDQVATILITDANGIITYVNDKFCELSKFSRKELIGQNPRILKSGQHPKVFYEEMWKILIAGKIWKGEVMDKTKDGRLLWMDTVIVPFMNSEQKPYQFVSFRTDITIKKLTEEEDLKLIAKLPFA